MSDVFNIDLRRLGLLWLPTFLRNVRTVAIVGYMAAPIETLYVEFLKRRKQNVIKMDFNYQKFSLQQRLNNAFDPIERRIRIVNAVQYEGVYLYTEAEDDAAYTKTQWLGDNPLYLRTESELTSEFDFIVEIPNTNINLYQLRAEIDFHILPSKRYEIVII